MSKKVYYYTSHLAHHGIKGQKWGLRQWQYKDGSYTSAGRIHYGIGNGNRVKKGSQKGETDKNTKKKSNTGKKLLVGLGVAAVAGYGVYKMSKLYADEKDKLEATQKAKTVVKGLESISMSSLNKMSNAALNKAQVDLWRSALNGQTSYTYSSVGMDMLKNVQDLLNQQYKDLGF